MKKSRTPLVASPRVLSLVLGVFSALLLLALSLNHVIDRRLRDLENITFDYRMQTRPTKPLNSDILLVGLTDFDLDKFHADIVTREHYFRLLQSLSMLAVDSVIFDIVFVDEIEIASQQITRELQDYTGDETLGFQMQLLRTFLPFFFYIRQRYPENVELEARQALIDETWYLPYDDSMSGSFGEGFAADKIKIPSPTLVQSATALGHINMIPDSDGVVRRIPLLIRFADPQLGDNLYPSISLRYVLERLGLTMRDLRVRFGDAIEFTAGDPPVTTRIPINDQGQLLINFREGEEFTTRGYSSETMQEIGRQLGVGTANLVSSMPDQFAVSGRTVRAADFRDSAVLVGEIAVASTDIRATSIDRALPMITVHANVINSILNRDFILVPPWWFEAAVMIVVGLIAGFVFGRVGYLRSFLMAPFLAVSLGVISWFAFAEYSFWMPLVLPLITLLVSGILILLLHLVTEEKRKAIIREAFEAYTSPEVVDEILQNIDDPALWGAKRRVTTLFVDIRGFTTLTEQSPPEMIVDMLSDYYQTAVEAIRKHGGIPNKFIGDAIMALFNAPRSLPNSEEAACRAAIDIQLAVRKLNKEKLVPRHGKAIEVGIGVNTGEVIVGIVGREKIEYTALGDDVNVASRLQGEARPGQVLIGQSTYESLESTAQEFLRTAIFQVRHIPEIVLKGLTRRFDVYELCYEKRQQTRA